MALSRSALCLKVEPDTNAKSRNTVAKRRTTAMTKIRRTSQPFQAGSGGAASETGVGTDDAASKTAAAGERSSDEAGGVAALGSGCDSRGTSGFLGGEFTGRPLDFRALDCRASDYLASDCLGLDCWALNLLALSPWASALR